MPGRSAADRLAEAHRLRREGRLKEAEAVYQQAAQEAAGALRETAWVALGKLRLDGLNQPGPALRAFRVALRAPHLLEAEASWGELRALQALGRTREESEALRRFLDRFPNRPEADAARRRRSELNGTGP